MGQIILWGIIISIGIVTYLTRCAFIVAPERARIPRQFQQALRFVPAAALTALVVPELVFAPGTTEFHLLSARSLAGFLAVVVAWYTRNVLLTIAVGMVALWVLQTTFQF